MADITMCNGKGCPLSYKCYRHNAKPTYFRQSYFKEPPYKDGKCNMLWEEDRKVRNRG